MKNRIRRELPKAIVRIRTSEGIRSYDLVRKARRVAELLQVLELNSSGEPESVVHVGDWVWVHYMKENGELDNNLALAVAILRYNNGKSEIALLWAKKIQGDSNSEDQHVVCTDECWIVEKENIASRVAEQESSGRVVTENSVGERFSLDRYHISSGAQAHPARIESISFETNGGLPCKQLLQELHLSSQFGQGHDSRGPLGSPGGDNQEAAVTQAETDTDVDNEVQVDRDTEIAVEAEAEEEATTGGTTDTQARANTAVKSGAQGAREPAVGPEAGFETQAEAEANIGSKTVRNIGVDAGMDTEVDNEVEVEKDTAIEAGNGAEYEAGSGTVVEVKAQLVVQPEAQSKTDAGAESAKGIGTDRDVSTAADTEAKPIASGSVLAFPLEAKTSGTRDHNNGTMSGESDAHISRKRTHETESDAERPQKKARPSRPEVRPVPRGEDLAKIPETTTDTTALQSPHRNQPLPKEDGVLEGDRVEKDVLFIRHKLQILLLPKKKVPTETDVEAAFGYLEQLEAYPNLQWPVISATKIFTAIKHVIDIPFIPREEEYGLKNRCASLLEAWKEQRALHSRAASKPSTLV